MEGTFVLCFKSGLFDFYFDKKVFTILILILKCFYEAHKIE